MTHPDRSVVVIPVDNSDPRDPAALCDRCGKRGTIAKSTLRSDPPEVHRYCGTCWPDARAALEAERTAAQARWQEAWRQGIDERRRNPRAQVPRPTPLPSWTTSSRSWHDTRRFLDRVRAGESTRPVAELLRIAADIGKQAPEMDGPMPLDIAEFVRKYERE